MISIDSSSRARIYAISLYMNFYLVDKKEFDKGSANSTPTRNVDGTWIAKKGANKGEGQAIQEIRVVK